MLIVKFHTSSGICINKENMKKLFLLLIFAIAGIGVVFAQQGSAQTAGSAAGNVSKEKKNNVIKDAFLPTPCYKGFIDFGYTVGVGSYGEGRVALSTTHGAQIIPHLFVGAGVGFNYFPESEVWNMPLYADFRTNFLKGKITPFLDFRLGYSVGDASGFYMAPTIGCDFGFGKKSGFSVALGYEFQKAEYYHYYYGYYYSSYYYSKENCGGVVIKIGVDF